ncbi:MAG: NAD-dependent protein deacetylase [Steroidobacteraceae bacterium]
MNPLQQFIQTHPRLTILTGAGVSTQSGIPDYRDADGAWKRAQPVQFKAFMDSEFVRQRYWARSLRGWPHFSSAQPNGAHRALASLETQGRIDLLVTQNVDGLHGQAGSQRVVDLHGRLDTVRCMSCNHNPARSEFQTELARRNPDWIALDASVAPDGDADMEGRDFAAFDLPSCPVCGGILKPDVVFFGESVPGERVEAAMASVERSDALLIIGSSLMVYSGYRFAAAASLAGKPIAAVNLGRTRADDLLALKVQERCADALAFLLDHPRRTAASSP